MRALLKKVPLLQRFWVKVKFAILARQLKPLLIALRPHKTDKALIRLGPQGDGGYLIPNDLEGVQACFSPGVNDISGFEKDCADRGIPAYLADASVNGPANKHELFHFQKIFLGATTKKNFITLEDWVSEAIGNHCTDLILQMDIEGAEYKVLQKATDQLLKKFRIIVIEFHNLDRISRHQIQVFYKILKQHTCVHIHPNNFESPVQIGSLSIPPVIECTFLRKDRIKHQENETQFPHPLDSDNSNHPSYALPTCWYEFTRKTHDKN